MVSFRAKISAIQKVKGKIETMFLIREHIKYRVEMEDLLLNMEISLSTWEKVMTMFYHLVTWQEAEERASDIIRFLKAHPVEKDFCEYMTKWEFPNDKKPLMRTTYMYNPLIKVEK